MSRPLDRGRGVETLNPKRLRLGWLGREHSLRGVSAPGEGGRESRSIAHPMKDWARTDT